jgi:hypothetical protein
MSVVIKFQQDSIDVDRRPHPVTVEDGNVLAGRDDATWLVGFQPFDAPEGEELVTRMQVEAEPLKAIGLCPVFNGLKGMFVVFAPVSDIALGKDGEIWL